jgi:hypothetical protein
MAESKSSEVVDIFSCTHMNESHCVMWISTAIQNYHVGEWFNLRVRELEGGLQQNLST